MTDKLTQAEQRACFKKECPNQKRCQAYGSCIAATVPEPGIKQTEEYKQGWNDCIDKILKVLEERFTKLI